MVITIVRQIEGMIFLIIVKLFSFPQDNMGPIPIIRKAGSIIGTTVEL